MTDEVKIVNEFDRNGHHFKIGVSADEQVSIQIMSLKLIMAIIFPALSAMRIFRQFRAVVIASAVISVVCFFIGLVVSYAFSTPTGASIVIVNLIMFLLCLSAGMIRKKVT